ncbi:hypothetical protein D5R40_11560 [Okeania hirsuta]|uniref:Uncharacterized protein n=1 Tax=Okeania hirsuta TaxID=1458930 RepID=A0A3N6RRP4_9CYAN|nr:hypothetical protein D4Z78_29005 [Okeania hirsuta]RQH44554.1 hypothetical protein D5R40_11560 [Okeania hirsuta]
MTFYSTKKIILSPEHPSLKRKLSTLMQTSIFKKKVEEYSPTPKEMNDELRCEQNKFSYDAIDITISG